MPNNSTGPTYEMAVLCVGSGQVQPYRKPDIRYIPSLMPKCLITMKGGRTPARARRTRGAAACGGRTRSTQDWSIASPQSRKYIFQFSLDIALSVNEIRLTDKQYCLPSLPKMFGKWKQFWVMEFVVKRSSNKGGIQRAEKHFIAPKLFGRYFL